MNATPVIVEAERSRGNTPAPTVLRGPMKGVSRAARYGRRSYTIRRAERAPDRLRRALDASLPREAPSAGAPGRGGGARLVCADGADRRPRPARLLPRADVRGGAGAP